MRKWLPITMLMLFTVLILADGAIAGTPTISNLSDFSSTEQDPAATVDSDVSLSGGGEYADGYLLFSVSSSDSHDNWGINSSANPTVDGEISLDGSDIYMGTGSSTKQVGTVDEIVDGLAGNDLKINFSSPLTNAGFETGDETGWTAYEEEYTSDLDGSSIDYNFSSGTITGTGTIGISEPSGMTYTVEITDSYVSSGTYALHLYSSGNIVSPRTNINQPTGNGSIHGPYVVSDPFEAESGSTLYLDWRAVKQSDAYEVFGYLINVDSGAEELLFSQRGDSTDWATITLGISTSATYRFRFVCGTYDQTGGLAVGAHLYIDNIRVVSDATITDEIVSNIARQVTYHNTSDNPSASRLYTVTAKTFDGSTGSASANINITGVNDAPTSIALSDNEIDVTDGSIGTLSTTDPDSSSFTYTLVTGTGDTDNSSFNISGSDLRANDADMPIGSYSVRVSSDDGAGGTVEDSFTLTVTDTDGDGLPDTYEGTGDTDGDGTPDYQDLDSDGDGVPDEQEALDGTDPYDAGAFADDDGDSVPNYVEENDSPATDPNDADDFTDTDGDGISDYREENGAFGIASDGEDPGAVTMAENSVDVTQAITVLAAGPVTFSITGGDDSAKFAINSLTGELTFISPPDYESPTDNDGDNVYEVVLHASDGTDTDTQDLSVTVTDVDPEPHPWDARSLTNSQGELFLGGNVVELGISGWGDFGTEYARPDNFYGTAVRSQIGMSHDPDQFGQGQDIRVDYFLPGSPEERFAVGFQSGGSTYTTSNAARRYAKNMTTTVENTTTGDRLSATIKSTWEGRMVIQQKVSFNEGDAFFRNEVTISNISGLDWDSARYMRSFDPDNTKDLGGSYTTDNTVLKTITDGDGKEVVVAQTYSDSDPVYKKTGSRMPIFFYSKDDRARASIFGFSNSNPYVSSAWDSPAVKGSTIRSDTAITMTFELGALADGQATRFIYYTSLDERDFDEVIEDIEIDDAGDPGPGESPAPVEEPIVSSSLLSIDGTPTDVTAANVAYSFIPTVTNPDGDAVTFSIENQPAWASFNTGTGALSGTPVNTDAGTCINVTISVSDEGGNSDTLTPFNIVVNAVNDPPSLVGTPASALEGNAYSFIPTLLDTDEIDVHRFSVVNLPDWAEFDITTGEISGTPGASDGDTDPSVYSGITITVVDGAGETGTLGPFSIDVSNSNIAPRITSGDGFSVTEGGTTVGTALAVDEDGDTITFSLAGDDAALFEIDDSGNISFVAMPNYESPIDADGDNEYELSLTISDGQGGSDTLAVTVTVLEMSAATDSDGDGISDAIEGVGDSDGDGIPNYLDTDSDNDGIEDGDESVGDRDGDGIPDYLDTDSDGDGVEDGDEGIGDSDGDGIPDYLDTDSDNDGVADVDEGTGDSDGDGIPDYLDTDSDNDGIADADEGYGDSDGDGIPDYLDTDSDGDGVEDRYEGTGDSDGDGIPDYRDTDSDGDGIADGDEDVDNDGTPDYLDTDSDNDGIEDADEGSNDTDGDGIPDYRDTDSDGDGISDAVEGTADTDNDGMPDYQDIEADGDGVDDEVENGGANNGDGNNDGIPDRLQARVTTLTNYDATEYVTFESPEGTTITNVQAIENPSPEQMPAGSTLAHGLYDFTIEGLEPGGSAQLILYLPEGEAPDSYLKYGPTPDNPEDHWYEFVYDGVTGAEINDNVITLHFVDGDEGDDVLTADGMIIDAGGPMVDSGDAPDSGDYGPMGGGGCFVGSLTTDGHFSGLVAGALAALLGLTVSLRLRALRKRFGVAGLIIALIMIAPGTGRAGDDGEGAFTPFYLNAGIGVAYIDENIGADYQGHHYEMKVDNDIYPVLRAGYAFSDNLALELGFRWDIYSGEMDRSGAGGSGNPKGYTFLLGPVYTFDEYQCKFLGPLKPLVHLDLGYTLLHDDPDFPVSEFDPALGVDIAVGVMRKNVDLRLGYRYFDLDGGALQDGTTNASGSLKLSGVYMEVAYRFNFGK